MAHAKTSPAGAGEGPSVQGARRREPESTRGVSDHWNLTSGITKR